MAMGQRRLRLVASDGEVVKPAWWAKRPPLRVRPVLGAVVIAVALALAGWWYLDPTLGGNLRAVQGYLAVAVGIAIVVLVVREQQRMRYGAPVSIVHVYHHYPEDRA